MKIGAKLKPGQARVRMVITRADGTVEDVGIVSSPLWHERLLGRFRIWWANAKTRLRVWREAR